ncbi:MAG: ABC transporter ATP-binding protein [Christensenellaceae bacterium]|nr:ABC transporter ATP-binding protein [Christensenellaceae bacterium]
MKQNNERFNALIALSKHIKGFRLYLIIAIFCNLIFKLLPLISSLVASYMVGSVLFGQAEQTRTLLIASAALVVLTAIFSYLDVFVGHEMAYRILAKLRNICYAQLDKLAPAAMQGKRSGDMINIVLNDVEQLEWFYAHTIGQIIVAVIIPTAALIFMGLFSWVLPVVMLCSIALMLWITIRHSKEADKQGAEVKKEAGILNAIAVDGVQGIKDIISFGWQKTYFKRFFAANKRYSDANMSYALRRSNETRFINLVAGIASLVETLITIILVKQGVIPAEWFIPLLILFSGVFIPINEALLMSTNYGLILGAAQRVLGLIQAEPEVKDEGNINKVPRAPKTLVKFDDVYFTYPASESETENPPVLEGSSFSFETGETVALVGASGSGKTTVARLLQRFWDVQGGSISINGIDIRELSLYALRSVVTVVPQEVYLFNVSVEENLRLAKADASKEEIIKACKQAQADEFIRKLPQGYNTVLGERGLRLSGGERQRLSIAQAILKDAPVLVLDEASANLDAENEKLINCAINQLKKGRATLVIAHRISTIRSADRIVLLEGGKVLAQGTYAKLMDSCPYFSQLIGEHYLKEE